MKVCWLWELWEDLVFNAFGYFDTVTHTQLFYSPLGFCPWLPRWAGTRKVNQEGKTSLDLLEQEIVGGSGIILAICKSAPWRRQCRHVTTPASHHSVFYRPDALPAAQPTASKHSRHEHWRHLDTVTCEIFWLTSIPVLHHPVQPLLLFLCLNSLFGIVVQRDLIPAAVDYWQKTLQVRHTGEPVRLLRYNSCFLLFSSFSSYLLIICPIAIA